MAHSDPAATGFVFAQIRHTKSIRRWETGMRRGLMSVVLGLAAFSGVASAQLSCPRAELAQIEPRASAETRPVRNGDDIILVRQNAITTTSDISEIKVEGDDFDTLILIKYNAAAAARLLAATTDNEGVQLAFVVDDDVLLSFTWEGPYGIGPGGVQMSIMNGLARAQKLVESLRGCTDPSTSD